MRKKVLIIDNNDDCLDVMTEALDYEGFEVVARTGTTDIFNLLDTCHPDLLLIDYLLDGVNGGEICSQVKRDNRTCSLPVIIISAYPKVIGSLGYYDCNAFIPKPFDLDDLTGKINELTNNRIPAHIS